MNDKMKDLDILQSHPNVFKIGSYQGIRKNTETECERTEIGIRSLYYLGLSKFALDIGSNAGLHSLIATRYCQHVVGLEPDEKWFKESVKMKAFFKKHLSYNYAADNATFHQTGISDYILRKQPDAIIANNVTHQLKDRDMPKVIRLLEDADKVVMQLRLDHPRPHNKYKMWELTTVTKMLEESGKTVEYTRPINTNRLLLLARRK